jgi:hypothetical protein
VVAEIFGEQFFVPVGSCEARFYRYWRNRKSLTEYSHYLMSSQFVQPLPLMRIPDDADQRSGMMPITIPF